jgi:predicted dithiol-disulfide oxidoreductase (DUF899 family)
VPTAVIWVETQDGNAAREKDLETGTRATAKEPNAMTEHEVGTREEWLAARVDLLQREKELTRQSDELARQRRELPWVRIDKDYLFDTEDGEATLADLFRGRSQLLVYHFMFGPDWDEGCPSCSAVADGFDETHLHLQNHDVAFTAVSRAPLEKLLAYRDRMGWSFPWTSSGRSDFNFDFNVSFTEEQQRTGAEYNFQRFPTMEPLFDAGVQPIVEQATATGTDPAGYMRQAPGMSAFALEDGVVYHTYSCYARGLDAINCAYQLLDLAPNGRDEDDLPWPMAWVRRHDAYEAESAVAVFPRGLMWNWRASGEGMHQGAGLPRSVAMLERSLGADRGSPDPPRAGPHPGVREFHIKPL